MQPEPEKSPIETIENNASKPIDTHTIGTHTESSSNWFWDLFTAPILPSESGGIGLGACPAEFRF